MSGHGEGVDPAEIQDAYRAKALAEIAQADRLLATAGTVASSGNPLAGVVLVKGEPGPAEASGGAALSGADGEAATKALVALGFDSESTFAVVSRPTQEAADEGRIERLAIILEAVDPAIVLGLDAVAAEDIAAALKIPALKFGVIARVAGRNIMCVDGLEAALADKVRKRRVWAQLQSLAPIEPVW